MDEFSEAVMDHGLVYFGAMTASISHEMKNYLAIINENAGLMEDLAMMAEQGRALEPQKIMAVCRGIQNQIKRADDTIKYMNTFGHSIDKVCSNFSLGEAMNLSLTLGGRLLGNRQVTCEVNVAGDMYMTTSKFYLMNLLWFIVDHITQSPLENGRMALSAQGQGDCFEILVSCDGQDPDLLLKELLSKDSICLLLGFLDGSLARGAGHCLVITLPVSLNQRRNTEKEEA